MVMKVEGQFTPQVFFSVAHEMVEPMVSVGDRWSQRTNATHSWQTTMSSSIFRVNHVTIQQRLSLEPSIFICFLTRVYVVRYLE